MAKEFKVYYAKVPGKTPGSYTMDHTAASFVFDPHGPGCACTSRYGGDAETRWPRTSRAAQPRLEPARDARK